MFSFLYHVLRNIKYRNLSRATPSPAGGLYPESRHNIGKVHSHGAAQGAGQGAEHDTEAAIQTILDTLGAGQWTKQVTRDTRHVTRDL